MASPDLHALAEKAHGLGLCVLPPKQDGSKQPDAETWTCYQKQRPTIDEIAAWYRTGCRTGIGLVCGAVSGHLELFEFDDGATYERFLELADEAGLGPLVARIMAGYEEQTPGGGIHWLVFLLEGRAKTIALARRMGTDAAGKPRAFPLIETKGEGGYVVIAPSHGHVHPSGTAYELISGGLDRITTITPAERDALWSLARTFDEIETPPSKEQQPKSDARWLLRPGDDFNTRATWPEVLEPHGWEEARTKGETTYWRRPGGYAGGWGASANHKGTDLLHVFTSAAPPFEADKSITKFTAYALLNHNGDFVEAAKALEAEGYGERRPDSDADPASSHPATPLVAVPPFPLDALPPVARRFVLDGAQALGCPPDFVVVPLFAFVGAVAGNSRKLRLKVGYEVLAIFWLGVVGKPGTVKTPALNLSRRLLHVLQQETWARYKQDLERWSEAKPAERGPKPQPEHYFATDTTTEAIAFALQTSRGIALIHDELAGWVLAFDAYRKAGDRQTWLSSWSAAPLKPNRKTGDPIYIPNPVVCVVGGIQPEVLPDLAGEAARDDGFLPRLLVSWPDAEPSPWTDEVMAERVFADLLAIVRHLRLPGDRVVITTLSTGAYREWVAWYDENRLLTGAARGLAAGWGAKAPVHLARIVLVLHLLTHPRDHERALSAGTMRDAIAILEYFRAHLARVLPAFGASVASHGARLGTRIHRILAKVFPEWVGRNDLAVKLGGHEASAAIDAALDDLAERGQAERRMVATAGRPRVEWRWVRDPDDDTDRPEDHEDDDDGGADPGDDPDGGPFPRNHVTPEHDFDPFEPDDVDGTPQRDKWKDVESPQADPFPRNHVITEHESASDNEQPDFPWETWEEGL